MTVRAAPFFCPYCGEQELEPSGGPSGWYCSSCDRRFDLRFDGLGERTAEAER
ncbi:MAG: Insertion element protein [Actinomycetota bacterium]